MTTAEAQVIVNDCLRLVEEMENLVTIAEGQGATNATSVSQ